MTASRIAPKLYQGSFPTPPSVLREQGIRTVVLCAAELQPGDRVFGGDIEVLRCPFDDNAAGIPPDTVLAVHRMATAVAARVRRQSRTLVTCAAGLNRSGLVTALTLVELYGISGNEAVTWVRQKRDGALFNPAFVGILAKIPARRPAPSPSP